MRSSAYTPSAPPAVRAPIPPREGTGVRKPRRARPGAARTTPASPAPVPRRPGGGVSRAQPGPRGQAELDQLTQKIVSAGLASWSGGETDQRRLIVRGAAHLLDDLKAVEDLERVRLLFDDLETKRGVIDLLGRAERAEGARIFIGSENKLFSLSGSSTIVAPYRDGAGRIVGVLGVIGPTRLNYARVIPMVDYTAKVVSKLIGG